MKRMEEQLEVRLEVFEGPLDLLLHLIEKNKVSIYDIPIAEITDQYIDYVTKMDHDDLDLVSDFLVMAATLLDIKARMLLPKEEEKEEEEDPRQDLVERLLEYKKYKCMSGELKDRGILADRIFYREQSLPPEVGHYRPPVDLDDLLGGVTLERLKQVYDDVMRRREDLRDPVRSNFGRIERETVQISDRIASVKKAVRGGRRHSFRELLNHGATKTEVVVTFLAVLELIKSGDIFLTEDSTRDDIIVEGRKPEESGEETDGNPGTGSSGEQPSGDHEAGQPGGKTSGDHEAVQTGKKPGGDHAAVSSGDVTDGIQEDGNR